MKTKLGQTLQKLYPQTPFAIVYPPKEVLGDYSTNIAFELRKAQNLPLLDTANMVASKIKDALKKEIKQVEVTPSGLVNIQLSEDYIFSQVKHILSRGKNYGDQKPRKKKKINLEFVSANPTGPLTLGNARAAAYGDTLASILAKAGHHVTREYYINNVGAQVELLGQSVARRYLQLRGIKTNYPQYLYQGEYITSLAQEMIQKEIIHVSEKEFDVLAETAKRYAVEYFLENIRQCLKRLGVIHEIWFKESELHESGAIETVLKELEQRRLTYQKDEALWFKASKLGFKQDMVLVRSKGRATYLASDFAYAQNKLRRGFDLLIYILGADHYDDAQRLKLGLKALGIDTAATVFILHQLVTLRRGKAILRMSKRRGAFVTLDDLLNEIPADVIRFFMLQRSLDTHLEFDLDLAKEQSHKNPVYYLQYAFARINSIFKKHGGEIPNARMAKGYFVLLDSKEEKDLLHFLIRFPEIVYDIAQNHQVHLMTNYTLELASRFHKFYETKQVLTQEKNLTTARLKLCSATYHVLGECLRLMGLERPETM